MIPPPTPTPMPVSTATYTLNFDGVSIWGMTPHAIQFWNTFPEETYALQWIIVMFLLLVMLTGIITLLNRLSQTE